MSKNRSGFTRVMGVTSVVLLSGMLTLPSMAIATSGASPKTVALEKATSSADVTAVKEFAAYINGLSMMNHLDKLSLNDAKDVTAALTAYAKLSDTQKTLVGNAARAGIANAKTMMGVLKRDPSISPNDIVAVQRFNRVVKSLPALSRLDRLGLEDAQDFVSVIAAYEKLTATQKALVASLMKAGLEGMNAYIANLPDPTQSLHMLRLYNPNSGEHFYTSDQAEHDNLVTLGWQDEGVAWTAPALSATPVFRLYNGNAGEHHYTTSVEERDTLVLAGWVDEGIGWYSSGSQGVKVYREYNPNELANNHNYTADKAEHDSLVNLGWNDEGIAWYGVEE